MQRAAPAKSPEKKPKLGKKEQAERTRRQILDAAIPLLAGRGYASTTMQELARAIGMTPGALYWHFDSKEDLLIAVLDDLERRMLVELDRVRGTIGSLAETDPRGLVRALVHHVGAVAEQHQHFILLAGVIGAEAVDTNARVEAALREAYDGVAAVAAEAFARALDRPEAADIECTAQMFLGLYMGGLMHQRLFRDRFPMSRALPVLERMLVAAATSEAER
jgi:AcrR family transcriptional regulator